MGGWTLLLFLALASGADGAGDGDRLVDGFGYGSLQGPGRLGVVRTWLDLRVGVGADLLKCPAADLVGVFMTGMVDTGTTDPGLRRSFGLELCEAMLPRLAPPELVPDPSGRLWVDPRRVPTRLREAATTARADLRRWCVTLATNGINGAPCRALRIRLVSREMAAWNPGAGGEVLDEIRRHCGNRETSRLALAVHALTGNDKDFERTRSLMTEADLAGDPFLAAILAFQEARLAERALQARWAKGELNAAAALLSDAAGVRDRDRIRLLADEVGKHGREGRTLAAVALARVGLVERARAVPADGDTALRVNIEVFAALQDALSRKNPKPEGLDRALKALEDVQPSASRRIRFVYQAVSGLSEAYASPDGMTRAAARLAVDGKALLDSSDEPALDLGVVAAQLYALEAWSELDRVLDHALKVHPADVEPAVAVTAARILLIMAAMQGDVDRAQQAHALLARDPARTPDADSASTQRRHLALAAELFLAVKGRPSLGVMDDLARRLQALEEDSGEALPLSDRSTLRANIFALSGAETPSRRRKALAGLWEDRPGAPLTLLLTALDRWHDGLYLEASLLLKILDRTGGGGVLSGTAAAWTDAVRRRSGATDAVVGHEIDGGSAGFQVRIDGDLRTRIFLDWDGRLGVEVHPRDRLLVLPSPPKDSRTR